jgi:hypothetical protein
MIRRDLFGGTDPDLDPDLHLSPPLATPWSNDDNLKHPIDINLSMISRLTPFRTPTIDCQTYTTTTPAINFDSTTDNRVIIHDRRSGELT